MKVVSLLIFWSVPFLFTFTGGYGHSLSGRWSEPPHAMAHGSSAVIQNADDASFPDDSGGGSLGSSLWEEDDSLEDVFVNTGHLLTGSLRIRGRGELLLPRRRGSRSPPNALPPSSSPLLRANRPAVAPVWSVPVLAIRNRRSSVVRFAGVIDPAPSTISMPDSPIRL